MSIAALSSFTPREPLSSCIDSRDAAGSFASDIAKRIAAQNAEKQTFAQNTAQTAPPVQAETAENTPSGGTAEGLQRLESSLRDTVSYLADTYGANAGTAMIGIIYQSIGNGEITEDTLGNALLDVISFVDKNFGLEAGDAFIDRLNGSLNNSLNEYFENGLTEQFMVKTTPVAAGSIYASNELADTGGNALVDLIKDMTESILEAVAEGRKQEGAAGRQPANQPGLAAYLMPRQQNPALGVLQNVTV